MMSRYCPIRPIDILIIQLLSPEVILELEQETTNDIPVFDLITLIYESISSDRRAEEYLTIPIARGTTEPPAKKTPNLFKELETNLNPKSVKISASQVWLGSYASSHLISSYIYMAVGHILNSIKKTIIFQ